MADARFSYFFLGLGLGAAAGLLLAPQSGEDTRNLIKSKADDSKEYLKRRGAELRDTAGEVVERATDVVTRQGDQVAAAVEAGKKAYREAWRPATAGPDEA